MRTQSIECLIFGPYVSCSDLSNILYSEIIYSVIIYSVFIYSVITLIRNLYNLYN